MPEEPLLNPGFKVEIIEVLNPDDVTDEMCQSYHHSTVVVSNLHPTVTQREFIDLFAGIGKQ